jgi:hypothetical protein
MNNKFLAARWVGKSRMNGHICAQRGSTTDLPCSCCTVNSHTQQVAQFLLLCHIIIWLAGVESILLCCMCQERMYHRFTKLAVVVAPKILTQQAAAVGFLVIVSYCLVVLSKNSMHDVHMRGCTVDLPSSFATNLQKASSHSSCCSFILFD